MANIKANEKSHIQGLKRNKINKGRISASKNLIKKAAASKDSKDFSLAQKSCDSLASRGMIHKNKANRIKSRLAKKINSK